MRLSYGSSVNVLLSLELTGSEDILTQVLKLSEGVTEKVLLVLDALGVEDI